MTRKLLEVDSLGCLRLERGKEVVVRRDLLLELGASTVELIHHFRVGLLAAQAYHQVDALELLARLGQQRLHLLRVGGDLGEESTGRVVLHLVVPLLAQCALCKPFVNISLEEEEDDKVGKQPKVDDDEAQLVGLHERARGVARPRRPHCRVKVLVVKLGSEPLHGADERHHRKADQHVEVEGLREGNEYGEQDHEDHGAPRLVRLLLRCLSLLALFPLALALPLERKPALLSLSLLRLLLLQECQEAARLAVVGLVRLEARQVRLRSHRLEARLRLVLLEGAQRQHELAELGSLQ